MRRPSTRAERMQYVESVRREIEEDEQRNPPRPTTQAARRRAVEVMAIGAGLPPPVWGHGARGTGERIDTSAWEASRAASLRAQHERFGRFGLAVARDRTIRCVRCREVVLAIPRARPCVMGAPVSALAMRHAQATGCR